MPNKQNVVNRFSTNDNSEKVPYSSSDLNLDNNIDVAIVIRRFTILLTVSNDASPFSDICFHTDADNVAIYRTEFGGSE